MSQEFITTHKIRFADCDPAGIGFYPRLVEMINNTIEDWFEQEINMSFHDMHLKHKLGIPLRKLSIEFSSPAHLGDLTEWTLIVARLGRSSIDLVVTANNPMGLRMLQANAAIVLCDLMDGKPKSKAIPDDMRTAMARFC